MTSKGPSRPTYANTVASLALFLTLAGGSALALEGRDTVDSGDIRDGQVKALDLRRAESPHLLGEPGEPQLRDGGQGDCLWRSLAAGSGQPFEAPSFYKDPFGVVHLAGGLVVADGPGGDGECDVSELDADDELIFSLPPGYRPSGLQVQAVAGGPDSSLDAETILSISPGSGVGSQPGGVAVVGDPTGLSGESDGGTLFLDGVSFRAVGPRG